MDNLAMRVQMLVPGASFGSASSLAALRLTWQDSRPCPTEAELAAVTVPSDYDLWRDEHKAGLTAFRAAFDATAGALVDAGHALPDPLTFRDLLSLLAGLGGDWRDMGTDLRAAYDEVLYGASGDYQLAYSYLPRILADETLVS